MVGDVTGTAPGRMSPIERMMWFAWEEYEGKTTMESMLVWLEIIKTILDRNGICYEDPRKEIETLEY